MGKMGANCHQKKKEASSNQKIIQQNKRKSLKIEWKGWDKGGKMEKIRK